MLRVRVALQSNYFRTFLGQNSARMNKIRSARTNLRTVGAPDSMIHRSKSPHEPVPASPKLDPLQHRAVMSLQTRRPPGHAKRKALTYAADIIHLRLQGYTLSAIREALEDAGVPVSISTVRREVLKGATTAVVHQPNEVHPGLHVALTNRGKAMTPVTAVTAVTATDLPTISTPLPGKAIAEKFMRGRPTNPLFLKESST